MNLPNEHFGNPHPNNMQTLSDIRTTLLPLVLKILRIWLFSGRVDRSDLPMSMKYLILRMIFTWRDPR